MHCLYNKIHKHKSDSTDSRTLSLSQSLFAKVMFLLSVRQISSFILFNSKMKSDSRNQWLPTLACHLLDLLLRLGHLVGSAPFLKKIQQKGTLYIMLNQTMLRPNMPKMQQEKGVQLIFHGIRSRIKQFLT